MERDSAGFKIHSPFPPAGDQPKAIEKLVKGVKDGLEYQTLVGVTGSGKSVTPETPVLIRDFQGTRFVEIGKYTDFLFIQHKNKIQVVGDTELLDTSNLWIETFSVNPKNGKASWNAVRQITRHVSPETLWNVETSCGRNVTATGDHNFYVLRNGELHLSKTADITENDFLPIPRSLPEPNNSFSYYVNIVQKSYFSESVLQSLSLSKRFSVENYGERVALKESGLMLTQGILVGARLGIEVEPIQEITPSFLRLLGYYIAEGHAAKQYMVISSADTEIIEDVKTEAGARGMSLRHRKDTYDYVLNGILWRDLFATWCGTHSQNKSLPPFWFELSNAQLAELLKAYFSGDGGVEKNTISATTVSKKLAFELQYALLRFGIAARVKRRMVKVPNKEYRNECWRIVISGQENMLKFQDQIGFVLPRKNKSLAKQIKSFANTNIDLIPIKGDQIRELRTILNLYQKDIADYIKVTRSYIPMLESGARKPSYTVAKKLFEYFSAFEPDVRVTEILGQWEMLLQLFWSPVAKLEKIPGTGYVYDFSVEGNETFLAGNGGIFVHNTYTVANVIQQIQKPTLIMAHNKTLAAQLAQEYREFFPDNQVHYFVSYYDYYQPEAYIAHSDTYIEKEAQINAEIDRLRHAATQALLTRKDVIIVASVSAIYGLGSPENYEKVHIKIAKGEEENRAALIRKLIRIYFERTTADLSPGQIRAVGNTVEFMPVNERAIYRILFTAGETGSTISAVEQLDPVSRAKVADHDSIFVFPAKHFVSDDDERQRAIQDIQAELDERLAQLKREEKPLEAERLKRRTQHDLAMIREIGYTNGIENYSRHFDGRAPGEAPYTLLSYFPHKADGTPDFLTVLDESHVTISQIGGMYAGDKSRKDNLIEFGFRLPSALDNRPLKFEEFEQRIGQVIFTTATPGNFEKEHSVPPKGQLVEQIIRPTGLIDPELIIRPIVGSNSNEAEGTPGYPGQIADFIAESEMVIKRGGRVLATTLTKQMAEDLSTFLREKGIKAEYLHSDVKTIDRITILTEFRKGTFDILVGVNLLREGLDLPEVELVGILDADKEGFLRSETSLIQTIGRAARNILGVVILYADVMTGSLERAISETNRRRAIQIAYNTEHGITPMTIKKEIRDIAESMRSEHDKTVHSLLSLDAKLYEEDPAAFLKDKRKQMADAVEQLDFETAALIRDEILTLEGKEVPAKKPRARGRRK